MRGSLLAARDDPGLVALGDEPDRLRRRLPLPPLPDEERLPAEYIRTYVHTCIRSDIYTYADKLRERERVPNEIGVANSCQHPCVSHRQTRVTNRRNQIEISWSISWSDFETRRCEV